MNSALFAILALIVLVAALVIAAVMLHLESRWYYCEHCKYYHQGETFSPVLPTGVDHEVKLATCQGCAESQEFFANRETEIAKEISRRSL